MPRPSLRSKKQKRKQLKTPGNKNTTHYWRKKPKRATCILCKQPLVSIPRLRPSKMKKINRVERRANRIESGRYCAKCLKSVIEEKVRNV